MKDEENDFVLDEYDSDNEGEKTGDRAPAMGGGNISPEVLKLLQGMAPAASVPKEEDEPDEIKVHLRLGESDFIDLLRLSNSFSTHAIHWRTIPSKLPSYI